MTATEEVMTDAAGQTARRSLAARIRRWRYDLPGKRDLRLDFLRGFAVIVMVIDHIGGAHSWLYAITGNDRFFVSAAEAFVFISGVVLGMVEAGILIRSGLDAALTKALTRFGVLYVLTVGLTFACMLLAALWRLPWAPHPPADDMAGFIVGVLTLHRTYYLTDVLLLYTLLMLAAGPALLLLEHRYTWLVLGLSWGLWGAWQLWPAQAQVPWEIADNGVFHFPAWQAIFLTGLVIGFHRHAIRARWVRLSPYPLLAVAAAPVVGMIGLYRSQLGIVTRVTPWHDAAALMNNAFGKSELRVGRIVAFAITMVAAYALVSVAWRPVRWLLGWLLQPLGQHALGAYMLHLFVVAILTKFAPHVVSAASTSPAALTALLQATGILAIWALIRLRAPLIAGAGWIGRWRAARRAPPVTPVANVQAPHSA